MNLDEAKFLLQSRRSGGGDAADPIFAEALAQAERDPKLKAWLEREQHFDVAIAQRLARVSPPPDLRDAILAGARASRPRRVWWHQPVWLAAAACFALLVAWGGGRLTEREAPSLDDLATLAAKELVTGHDRHEGRPRDLAAVQAQLASASGLMRAAPELNLGDLRRRQCRSVRIAGREMFEICFARDGVWYHLYVMSGASRGGPGREAEARFERAAAVAWSDARNSYALVTDAGREALRRAL